MPAGQGASRSQIAAAVGQPTAISRVRAARGALHAEGPHTLQSMWLPSSLQRDQSKDSVASPSAGSRV